MLVTLQTENLAREKGYRFSESNFFVPSQQELLEWLIGRGICINLNAHPTTSTKSGVYWWYGVNINSDGYTFEKMLVSPGGFMNYNECLEEALRIGLKNLE